LTSEIAGLFASLGAAFVWAASTSIYRIYGVGKSATWLNFFKCIVALCCFSIVFIWQGHSLLDNNLNFYLVLAISGVIGILLGDSAFFAALPDIGATLTSSVQCLAPPLTAIFAWIFLGERLGILKIYGIGVTSVCLAGLIWFESRGPRRPIHSISSNFRRGILLAFVAAMCQAIGAVIARPVLGDVSPFVTGAARIWLPTLLLFYFESRRSKGLGTLISELVTAKERVPLFIAGVVGTFLGLALMMYGMSHAPTGVAIALSTTYPVWIMLGDRIFGVAKLSKRGAALVVGCVAGIWMMV
jgi:drug/metabolite transporter (DMT)-like permease